MGVDAIPVDELIARGLGPITTPVELDATMQAVISAIPKEVSQEDVFMLFAGAWVHVRGQSP